MKFIEIQYVTIYEQCDIIYERSHNMNASNLTKIIQDSHFIELLISSNLDKFELNF